MRPVRKPHPWLVFLGLVGAVFYALSLYTLRDLQFNIVRYEIENVALPIHAFSTSFAASLMLLHFGYVVWKNRHHAAITPWRSASATCAPLILSVPLVVSALSNGTPSFAFALLLIVGAGWSIYLAGRFYVPKDSPRNEELIDTKATVLALGNKHHFMALGSILLIVLVLTMVHTRIQINFFEHFMLGHADFGHYTEEFKNALTGRGLRSDSFPNTRLGWHFSPLLYIMVPGYWLWPSPKYLMVCSALFVHLPAIPAFFFAKRRSDSVLTAWLFAVAWLLLPSCSRLVYSNTYGFQWIYAMMAPLGLMVAAGVSGRWRTCLVIIAVILAAKETTAAIVFGFGLYVALFTPRRVIGVAIVVVSLAYAAICIYWIIPHYADSGRYERMELFGSLGGSFAELATSAFTQPTEFFGRLLRPEAGYFVLTLLVSMAWLPLRGWRIALATLPSLVLILLMENSDWLNIKFWHQATVLPILFFGGIAALGNSTSLGNTPQPAGPSNDSAMVSARRRTTSLALAALVCAAWGHYFFGFSPLSRSYQVYAHNSGLHTPDPRLAAVQQLRAAIPRDRTILATERLAAHFTDYRRLYTGNRPLPADFVLIDPDDHWDRTGLPQRAIDFARDPHYAHFGEFGRLIVFQRRADAPIERGLDP